MKNRIGMLLFLALNTNLYAAGQLPDLGLDTVSFQVAAKQWVNTQTALLIVNINATLTSADLVKARADMMNKLSKIANGDWHLSQFDRSQDNSGLEKLHVQAQVRIAQDRLTSIYQSAKSVSVPGATYEIASVEFTPSLDEVQQVRTQLREKIYQMVRDELARLNKIYEGQTYTLNSLVFSDGDVIALPQAKTYASPEGVNAIATSVAPNLTVSNELNMTAMVQAAANRAH